MANSAESGLITKASRHSVPETIERFETAVKAKGWMVFTRIDHAAAASAHGLALRPRTVVIFGNPQGGTPGMKAAPTLAIDLPLKALVWEDDQGKVWLTHNSADCLARHVYPRHGLSMNDSARNSLVQFLDTVTDQAV